jgi:asparagine synthase (glutamine-hydrolysing)
MCGICGKVLIRDNQAGTGMIESMCRTLNHRGPDDQGIYCAPHVYLGQRRLSIIDLASSACPPLKNEDGTIWLVFNGEIYNFQELRSKLIMRGHRFATGSDTEVIIHLYEEHGVDCLKQLRGMFAFALWDSKQERLFCARDRLGKKPLCYAQTANGLVFGSEIKAITADPEISKEPDYQAINLSLTYQFVPSPYTAFKGIRRLGPGTYFTYDLKGRLEVKRFWEPPYVKKSNASLEEIEAELVQRLREAVKLRMIADVPLGAFLSGGIDSACIVALMAQESSRPVKTFSIGFEEDAYNELPYAKLIAERYGTEHHELIVKPNAVEVLPLLVRHYNEPFADSSALPTFYVSKMTRQHVTVAISGDGGDESFAGYDNYGAILGWGQWDRWPLPLRRLFAQGARELLSPFIFNNLVARLRRGLAMVGAANVRERRLQYGTLLKPEEKRLGYTAQFWSLIGQSEDTSDPLTSYSYENGMDGLDWLMRHDQSYYLPDCLMVKTDIASMANSLEVRCPFLDHELVEFAATIPSHFKRGATGTKLILKSAMKHLLPAEILNKRKTGFGIPIGKWLRTDLASMLKETLLSDICARRGLLEPQLLDKMIGEHLAGRRDWSGRLWAFLFMELWFREFID